MGQVYLEGEEKMRLKRGEEVEVYEDPVTRRRLEGYAVVVFDYSEDVE